MWLPREGDGGGCRVTAGIAGTSGVEAQRLGKVG